MNKKGKFIVFEGVDGAGKSTILEKVTQKINEKYNNIVFATREPGGASNAQAESIRSFFISQLEAFDPITLAYLYAASRNEHILKTVIPMVNDGKIVISDRFVYSSYVYQGLSNGIDIKTIYEINKHTFDKLDVIDYIFYFDINAHNAFLRRQNRIIENAFDKKDEKFYEILLEKYKDAIKHKPFAKKIIYVNANNSLEEVTLEVYNHLVKIIESK